MVGVDTGGTFTDLVVLVGGRIRVAKLRSTPDDPARAVRDGLRALALAPRTASLHYGTTVATNALLERRGARVVLVTTAGFEDVIEIGRQVRPSLYALEPRRPPPLVPRARRLGVAERVLADGRVERPLERRAVVRLVKAVLRHRPEAVAVSLLHSYAAPRHERLLARAFAARGVHLTLSHRLVREHREYERTATVVVNAYVGPLMTRHLGTLARAVSGGLRVMQSSGGLVTARTAAAEPVRTILSGPAGGVVGATAAARRARLGPIVTLDMGGTSTDVSLVAGPVAYRTETSVDGLPVRVPALDIHTVGAGGGSLARLDPGGALRVGPESAGADPGPACYGRGAEPTVTDANLVLGRLVETEFLGGALHVDRRRAVAAIAPLARRLGGSIEDAAAGIVRVATATMERAVRVITIERGQDPRDFTLVAFGGAGAVHAAELAAELGLARVYVPRHPGLLSAWGVMAAETIRDFAATLRAVEPSNAAVAGRFRGLERAAIAALRREGLARPVLERALDVRYAGQAYEVQVPYRPGWRAAFHRRHAVLFGHADPRRPLEVVALRLRARGGGVRPPHDPVPGRGHRPAPIARRRVVFAGRAWPTSVYRRADLPAGWRARGPLIVCEYSATTVVPPGWRLHVDRTAGLVLERR